MEQKLFSILHPPPKSSEVSIISPDKKKGKSSNLAKEGRVREKKLKPQLQVITTFRSQHGEMIWCLSEGSLVKLTQTSPSALC